MSQQKPLSVLISGAGVAGMTLALALARHPTMQPRPIITVLERFATPRTTGQAIDIRGPAVRLLHQLEIEGKVKARHTTETGIAFIGMNGKEVARFDKTDDSQKQSATSEYEILRGDLVGLLMEETEEAKKISGTEVNVVCGEYITSLKEDEDGVAVTFANGKLQSQKFDVVIASDGMASRTRPMIFPDLKPEECIEPWGMYVAYFTIPRIESDTRVWKWFHAPGGLAVHLRPHRNPNTMGAYLGITLPTKAHSPELDAILAKGPEAEKALLHERFKGLGWEVDRILSAMDHADDFYMHHSCRVEVSKWTASRCALIGDTAHATMGIGTSNAMIGGYMVAGELAKMKANSQEEIAAALKRYEEGLRPLAGGEKSKGPPGYPQMANPQTSWGISLFHTIAWVIKFTRLEKLLMMGVGEPDENEWKLPSYGFTGSN